MHRKGLAGHRAEATRRELSSEHTEEGENGCIIVLCEF
jgi:hypothetical protein